MTALAFSRQAGMPSSFHVSMSSHRVMRFDWLHGGVLAMEGGAEDDRSTATAFSRQRGVRRAARQASHLGGSYPAQWALPHPCSSSHLCAPSPPTICSATSTCTLRTSPLPT